MNTASGALSDPRVRRAIDTLLNRSLLRTDGLEKTRSTKQLGSLDDRSLSATLRVCKSKSLPSSPRNETQADSLFKEAGYALGSRTTAPWSAAPHHQGPNWGRGGHRTAECPTLPKSSAASCAPAAAGPSFTTVDDAQWARAASAGLNTKFDMVIGTTNKAGFLGVEDLFHSTGEMNFFRHSNATADRLIGGLRPRSCLDGGSLRSVGITHAPCTRTPLLVCGSLSHGAPGRHAYHRSSLRQKATLPTLSLGLSNRDDTTASHQFAHRLLPETFFRQPEAWVTR